MSEPLVSCLMPTADRRRYVPLALATFLEQDYGPRELIVLDDGHDPIADLIPPDPRIRYLYLRAGRSLGEKRNEACRLARGDILVHWDDDDWSAPWRVSYQVAELQRHAADVCGLDRLWFYDPDRDLAWRFRYPAGRTPWLAGSTLCFRRHLWERRPFPNLSVGEDTLWIAEAVGARVLPLARDDFFVARVHEHNTCPKETDGFWWARADPSRLRDWLGVAAGPGPELPLVSCILATGGRRRFAELALECFLTQQYPRTELVIVDDGRERVDDVFAAVAGAKYFHLPERRSVGAKRYLGCAASTGEMLALWADDDWYGAARLSRQVAPLVDGRADITALETRWIAELPSGEFWAVSPEVHRRMFYCDVHGGTLAFTRAVWAAIAQSPEETLLQRGFLHEALNCRARLLRVANDELFVYNRHGANSWDFPVGRHVDPSGWGRTQAPASFQRIVQSRYQFAARAPGV